MIFTIKRRAAAGFTLIELLIVVIILAILAAIVIPQYASTTGDAREGALDANLSTMRSSIELYKIQHKNLYPGAAASNAGGTCAGTKGLATAAGAQAFIDQMTNASDDAGNTCSVSDPANYRFGPYVRGAIPAEPINNKGAIAADIVVTSVGTPITAGTVGGWAFDTKSGQFIMNSSAMDIKNKAFSSH